MATKLNSILILFWRYQYSLTYQSYVRSNFSHQQKPYSHIHRPPTNELDCTQTIYDSREMLMKIENHLRDSELRSIHMPIM